MRFLYKGTFNFSGQVMILYTHSASKTQAYTALIKKLAPMVKYTDSYLRRYFSGDKDNYRIELLQSHLTDKPNLP
jgi:hypothetical protein